MHDEHGLTKEVAFGPCWARDYALYSRTAVQMSCPQEDELERINRVERDLARYERDLARYQLELTVWKATVLRLRRPLQRGQTRATGTTTRSV